MMEILSLILAMVMLHQSSVSSQGKMSKCMKNYEKQQRREEPEDEVDDTRVLSVSDMFSVPVACHAKLGLYPNCRFVDK